MIDQCHTKVDLQGPNRLHGLKPKWVFKIPDYEYVYTIKHSILITRVNLNKHDWINLDKCVVITA